MGVETSESVVAGKARLIPPTLESFDLSNVFDEHTYCCVVK